MQSIIEMYRVMYAEDEEALEELQELETAARVSPCQNVTAREI